MFSRLRFYLGLYKELKETPEIPEVTNYLENSKKFEKMSLTIHNLKLKAWQKLDEAAFPEEYENKKYIEQNPQSQNKYTQNQNQAQASRQNSNKKS